jgi:hypothetical protein
MIELDHVSLGVRNLYEGAHRLRDESGLDNYEGGWFPVGGLANRIVPLPGDVYIEIESNIDAADTHPLTDWFRTSTRDTDAWMFWCLRATTMGEMEAIAERFGSKVARAEPGRIRPNGEHVCWTMTPSPPTCWGEGLPNWYYWEDMSGHPSRRPVEHRRRLTGVAWLEVGGDPAVMERHIGVEAMAGLPLRFVDAPGGLYALAIETADGDEVVVRRPTAAGLFPGATPPA